MRVRRATCASRGRYRSIVFVHRIRLAVIEAVVVEAVFLLVATALVLAVEILIHERPRFRSFVPHKRLILALLPLRRQSFPLRFHFPLSLGQSLFPRAQFHLLVPAPFRSLQLRSHPSHVLGALFLLLLRDLLDQGCVAGL